LTFVEIERYVRSLISPDFQVEMEFTSILCRIGFGISELLFGGRLRLGGEI